MGWMPLGKGVAVEFQGLVESFEKGVAEAESYKADTKTVRRAVKIVDELEGMDLPVMIEVPDASGLRAWLDTAKGGDLSETASKVQSALDVSDVLGVPEEQVTVAVKVLERYRALAGNGQGSRYLSQPITMHLPDGKTRRSNKGDWTSIRNQARTLTELSKEDLDDVRSLLREGKNAEVDGIKFVLG
jgi:hypothetical protein